MPQEYVTIDFIQEIDKMKGLWGQGISEPLILVENIKKGFGGKRLIKHIKNKGFSYKGYAGKYQFDENGDVNFGGRWKIKKVY